MSSIWNRWWNVVVFRCSAHQTWQICIYTTMHIYPWHIDSPSHLSIDAFHTAIQTYMLEVFGVVVFHISMVNWSWGGRCILSTYAFWYIWNLFGVMVLHRSTVNWTRGYMYPQYMCILLYVKLILCNDIP